MTAAAADPNPAPNVLELRNVSKTFQDAQGRPFQAIRDVDLVIPDVPGRGEFRVFLGPSGCGKSTILNIVAGLLKPTTGEALLRGVPIAGPGPDRGMVFQNYSSYPWLTVLENVAFGLALRGVPRRVREDQARAWTKKVGLEGSEHKYPRQLSGGMRQRVAIARTLAVRPQIILMDEPFGALDVRIRLGMQNLINELWEEIEGTILFVTHDIAEAVYLGDVIHILSSAPGTLAEEIEIDLPPRRTEDLKDSKRFRELETLVLERIKAQAAGGSLRITT
jgi:NitT/TauT family transport system ATP-binding protein